MNIKKLKRNISENKIMSAKNIRLPSLRNQDWKIVKAV